MSHNEAVENLRDTVKNSRGSAAEIPRPFGLAQGRLFESREDRGSLSFMVSVGKGGPASPSPQTQRSKINFKSGGQECPPYTSGRSEVQARAGELQARSRFLTAEAVRNDKELGDGSLGLTLGANS
jgi:hypothetical protein